MQKGILEIISFLLFNFSILVSQNIIPNGSFETYTACPNSANTNSPDEIKKTVDWYTIKQTPDYFHTCATTTIVSVPNNFLGYQTPSSGSAYTGLWAYENGNLNFREVLAAKLTTTLVVGQKYFIKLTASLAEGYNSNCGTDKLGLRFSTVQHKLSALPPINNFAHLYFNTIMADTLNWKSIFKSFIADSNYQYVEIGNFFSDINTNIQVLKPGANWAYYYIDDVCLSVDSLEALGFNSSTGIFEKQSEKQANIFYPNPSTGIIYFNQKDYDSLKIMDIYGNNITDKVLTEKDLLNFNTIQNGIYFITIKSKNKIKTEKIIINN